MAKNEKNTQKATNRAVNTKGSMQSGNKSTNCNKADNKTASQSTNSVDGCGCGSKNGDGERKK